MTDVATPTAGWYADPSDGTRMRWWDGSGWTEHTEPLPATSPSLDESASPSSISLDAVFTPRAPLVEAAPSSRSARAWDAISEDPELLARIGRGLAGDALPTSTMPDAPRYTTATAPAWLLALSPGIWAAMVGIASLITIWQHGDLWLGVLLAVMVLHLGTTVTIWLDGSVLGATGHPVPHRVMLFLALLLGAGPYLLVRTLRLRRQGTGSWRLLVVFLVLAGVVTAVGALALRFAPELSSAATPDARPSAATAAPHPVATVPPHGELTTSVAIPERAISALDPKQTKNQLTRSLIAIDEKLSNHEWRISCPNGEQPFPIGETDCLAVQVPTSTDTTISVQHLVFVVYPDGHATLSGTAELYAR